MFIIRADGNAKIGAGHLMRCLTIAEAVKKLPGAPEILVLCADDESASMASDRGFDAGVFHTDYRQPEAELPLWEQWIRDVQNTILVDSYYVTDVYLQELRRFGKVCLMDDMQNHTYPVDAVINYNVFADAKVYRDLYCDEQVKLYLGGAYAPLRQQFQDVDYCVRDEVKQVLLTTGAGDSDNIAGTIMDRIYRENIVYHVLVGCFSPHLNGWQERAKKCANIQVHFDVRDMAALMKQCDVAVSAGGSTVYELSAVGVPFIAFSYAQNQELLVEYLRANDMAGSAGAWHRNRERTAGQIAVLFDALCKSSDLRREYSRKERLLVDGHGAQRLARVLCVEENTF